MPKPHHIWDPRQLTRVSYQRVRPGSPLPLTTFCFIHPEFLSFLDSRGYFLVLCLKYSHRSLFVGLIPACPLRHTSKALFSQEPFLTLFFFPTNITQTLLYVSMYPLWKHGFSYTSLFSSLCSTTRIAGPF